MISKRILKPVLFFFFMSVMLSCSTDDADSTSPETGKYNTKVYITDAPIDNAEVSGVFVTIADVSVNGTSLEGFQRSTLEISSLTNGSTQLLGNLDLLAGSTSSVVLQLDNTTDAAGNAPGSYVLTVDGTKKALVSATNTITVNDKAEVFESANNELVIDFDLRKSIVANSNGEYSFASASRLSNGLRVVNNLNAGTITGKVENISSSESETVVVFAYEKGSFNESEMQEDENHTGFSNAATSSLVSKSNGSFSLHFIEEGDYELHFVSYEDTDADGRLEVQGEVETTTTAGLDLGVVNVTANSTTSVDILFEGLLNL